jgi:hypothetical protein
LAGSRCRRHQGDFSGVLAGLSLPGRRPVLAAYGAESIAALIRRRNCATYLVTRLLQKFRFRIVAERAVSGTGRRAHSSPRVAACSGCPQWAQGSTSWELQAARRDFAAGRRWQAPPRGPSGEAGAVGAKARPGYAAGARRMGGPDPCPARVVVPAPHAVVSVTPVHRAGSTAKPRRSAGRGGAGSRWVDRLGRRRAGQAWPPAAATGHRPALIADGNSLEAGQYGVF